MRFEPVGVQTPPLNLYVLVVSQPPAVVSLDRELSVEVAVRETSFLPQVVTAVPLKMSLCPVVQLPKDVLVALPVSVKPVDCEPSRLNPT